jgi:cadmium resistance protein CadD (predicted permease)
MNPKQKVTIFGSVGLLILVGLVFIIKGWQVQEQILLFLGILLIVMGIGRGMMLKKYLPKDLEDTSLDDYLEEDSEEEE